MKTLTFLLFATVSVAAQPVITSVTPSSGPAAGGTTITIKGKGFEFCQPCSPPIPPRVYFGGVEVFAEVINTTTLEVVLPPKLPGTTDVSVRQSNGFARLENAFTYTGTVEEAFERVLLPIFTPRTLGAFNSEFFTTLAIANTSSDRSTWLFGLGLPCGIEVCLPYDLRENPYEIEPGVSHPGDFDYIGTPGRFFYIARSAPNVFANLLVRDSSRSRYYFGTEIPVVRENQFIRGPITLLGVPLDPRFRNTLRIYAVEPLTVVVRFGNESHAVTLRPGQDLFDPAYGYFNAFPIGTGTVDVTVTPPAGSPPLWAFMSVTNNDTQLITTISPQR